MLGSYESGFVDRAFSGPTALKQYSETQALVNFDIFIEHVYMYFAVSLYISIYTNAEGQVAENHGPP